MQIPIQAAGAEADTELQEQEVLIQVALSLSDLLGEPSLQHVLSILQPLLTDCMVHATAAVPAGSNAASNKQVGQNKELKCGFWMTGSISRRPGK